MRAVETLLAAGLTALLVALVSACGVTGGGGRGGLGVPGPDDRAVRDRLLLWGGVTMTERLAVLLCSIGLLITFAACGTGNETHFGPGSCQQVSNNDDGSSSTQRCNSPDDNRDQSTTNNHAEPTPDEE